MIDDNGFDEKKLKNASIVQFLVGVPEINSLKEKRKLLLRDLCGLLAVHRPGELIFFQAFQPQAETVFVPINDFQDTPESIAEQKQIALKGIHLQLFRYDDRKPVDLFAHIRRPRLHKKPDLFPIQYHLKRFQRFHNHTKEVRLNTIVDFYSVFTCNNDMYRTIGNGD